VVMSFRRLQGVTDSPLASRAWRCGLGTWRTHVVFLYLVALLPLPLFFRFVVLV
jgi:hypothetical protein